MMSVEMAIRSEILAAAAVSALTTRVYPVAPPQNPVLPYIRYQVTSRDPWHTMGGTTNRQISRVQIDVVADTYAGAAVLADHVRAALHMKRGIIGTGATQAFVDLLKLDDQTDEYEAPGGDGTQYGPFRMIQDYIVIHATT